MSGLGDSLADDFSKVENPYEREEFIMSLSSNQKVSRKEQLKYELEVGAKIS